MSNLAIGIFIGFTAFPALLCLAAIFATHEAEWLAGVLNAAFEVGMKVAMAIEVVGKARMDKTEGAA